MTFFTFGQLADPLVTGVTGLWHEFVSQVTVHSTLPPVIFLILILYEGHHHLHKNRQRKPVQLGYSLCLWPWYHKACG